MYRFADTSAKLRLLPSLPWKQKQELSLTGEQSRSFAYLRFAKKKGRVVILVWQSFWGTDSLRNSSYLPDKSPQRSGGAPVAGKGIGHVLWHVRSGGEVP